MTENRDFLAEFEQLRVETDGIRNVLVSKPVQYKNLLKEMMGELKEMRKEIKVIDEKNDKKFEELKLELKKEIVEQNLIMEQRTKKVKDELLEELKKLRKEIPIRKAVLGEWKMVEYQNYEDAGRSLGWSFEKFSKNLKFELVAGKLKQSGAGLYDRSEGDYGVKMLYVEDDDHLKSICCGRHTDDIYIENGSLHYVQNWNGVVFKRIYEKNGASRMVPISEVEKLRVENKKLGEQMSALTAHFERFVAEKEAKKLQQPQQSLPLSQKVIIFAFVFLFISGFTSLMITRIHGTPVGAMI